MSQARSLDKAEANGGYSWIENSFIKKLLTGLSGQAVKAYVYLTSNTPYNKKSEQVTKPLSASSIAEALGCTGRTVTKALNELEGLGVIERLRTPGGTNRYRLLATSEENFPGDRKESSQGYEENFLPPSQVDAAKPCETRTGGSSKNILRVSKNLRVGIRPPQTPLGSGPRKV